MNNNNYVNDGNNSSSSNGMGTFPVNNMSNNVNMNGGNGLSNVNQGVNNMPSFNNVNQGNNMSFNGMQGANVNNDDELLRIFIGNNYDKITKNTFNVSGFFFATFYLFYRKMFLYGILLFLINLFLLNVLKSYFLVLVMNVLVGFFVNKLYLKFAKKEIEKLKVKYQGMSYNDLKMFCARKGGTSVGNIFLGFLAEFGITFVVIVIMLIAGIGNMFGDLVDPDNWNFIEDNNTSSDSESDDSSVNNSYSSSDKQVLKDVKIDSTMCLGDDCTVSIDWVYYAFKAKDFELFEILNDYRDYITIDIYYVKETTNLTFTTSDYSIVDYKVYSKSTKEEIINVKTEDELRKKLGFYAEGENTGIFVLDEIVGTGVGTNDDDTYTFSRYVLIDANDVEYIMDLIYTNDSEIPNNLIVGNKYNVTFNVVKDEFGYDYFIKSFK